MQNFNNNILGLGITILLTAIPKFLKLSFFVLDISDDDIENVENIKKYEKSYVVFLKT